MNDVMLDEASLWLNEHEPPLHKQKLEAPPSPVEDVYFSDEEDMNHEEQEKYRLQVVESCGFDVDLFIHTFNGIIPSGCTPYDTLFAKAGLHCYNLEKGKKLQLKSVLKVNAEIGSLYNSYSSSEVMDPVNNSLHTFQTLVTDAGKMNKARLILVTKICRIKPQVPGIGDANVFWDFDAIDVFYKGDMPNWPLNDAFIKGDKLLFYEVKESELRDNEWISLYAEAALFSEWHSDMSAYTPFEMKRVVVQTKEDVESSMKLKSSNAIFFMSFICLCSFLLSTESDGPKLQVKESELRDNEWISLFAEAALFSEWHSDMSAYTPFEMKKVVVQTKEDVESSMKLKSSNAIFYMSFKVREGPDCRGIVRKTSDGRTGHMCLEARCWIDK